MLLPATALAAALESSFNGPTALGLETSLYTQNCPPLKSVTMYLILLVKPERLHQPAVATEGAMGIVSLSRELVPLTVTGT